MSSTLPPLRLRLLGPAITFIVAATMIPTGLRHPSLIHIANGVEPVDVINNLILYMPLGLALAGLSWRRAFLCGLLLSTFAETLQLGYVDRIPSFVDIFCNTTGTLLGHAAATYWLRMRRFDTRWLKISRQLALSAIPIAILGTIMLLVHRPQPNFSNWSPDARLLIGDEVTGGRPWAGNITALQIYPFALGAAQISNLARNAPSFPGGGLLPTMDLSVSSGGALLSRAQERALYDSLAKQSQMTLLLRAQPANVNQAGPARIVTYSQDAFDRNFTLGQVRSGLTFRLRTPVTGLNGTDPALYTGPILVANQTSFMAVTYDGRVSSLYVDGNLVAHMDLGLRRPHLPKRVLARLPGSIPIRVIELAATEMFCSGLLTLGVLALPGVPQRRAVRFLLGSAAGLAVGMTIWVFGVSSPGLGFRITLECVAAGLIIAASVQTQTIG